MVYGDFKDLARRTASDKVLQDKAFNIAENPKYHRYQRRLASMVYKFTDKNTTLFANKSASGRAVKSEIAQNKKLAQKLLKPIIRKFEKRKVYSSFVDNICINDLALCN